MSSYQINDLERLTGIKAHTIRIWEKRYGLITPGRTDTNRRFYDDHQVRKLLNVTTLMSYGHKISKIAALSDEQISEAVEKGATGNDYAHVYAGYVNDMVTSMLAYDENGFERVFSAAALRLGLHDTMLRVVYPFLNKVGVLWSINKAAPVQEHFASCIIRRKMMAVLDGMLPSQSPQKTFLLFLPGGEWHEIGLLFADYILRKKGCHTVYLGQNVPLQNVTGTVQAVKPDYLLTLFTAARPAEEINMLLQAYHEADSNAVILYSGAAELIAGAENDGTKIRRLSGVDELELFLDNV